MLEKDLESKARKYIKTTYGGELYKWVSPGTTGVPDRIVILPKGVTVYVEFKKPGVKDGVSPTQKKRIDKFKALGHKVWVVNDLADFKQKIETLGFEVDFD